MKVFDFTSGVKGEELASIPIVAGTGSWFVEKNGMRFKVELAKPRKPRVGEERWGWNNSAYTYSEKTGQKPIRPEDFGVEAICFCMGELFYEWYAGHPEAKSAWEWIVLGTNDWNRKACKAGILKATKMEKV